VRFDHTRRSLIYIASSLTLFVGLLSVLLVAGGQTLFTFLERGNYALADLSLYFQRLALSLVSFCYYADGSKIFFLTEDVHVLVDHSVLSVLWAPFFCFGWWKAWQTPSRLLYCAVIVWTAGMVLCALAGPNAKYLLVFFPVTLLVALSGLRHFSEYLAPKLGNNERVGLFCICSIVLVASFELKDVFVRFPASERHIANALSREIAKFALVEERTKRWSRVYIQVGNGYDALIWNLRFQPAKKSIFVYSSPIQLKKEMEVVGARQ